jgi:four helix bundle protein
MKTFEDLPVWQAGRELVRRTYALTRRRPFRGDPGLCGQIQRAAVSVPSNIAEGHERGSTQDLVQFLFYAKGSAGEVRSQLYHAEDLGYADAEVCEDLRSLCRDISRQISAWVQSMQAPGFRAGPKFHKEPDRAWDRFAARANLERLPDGRYLPRTEGRNTEGRNTEGRNAEGQNGEGRNEGKDGRGKGATDQEWHA